MKNSCAHIRGSRSGLRISWPEARPRPKTPPRRGSSRRTARSARFRRGSPFRPWLLQIVANEARNRRRAAGRRAGLALRAAAEGSSGGAAPSPEGVLLAAEERERLLEAVNALREEERLVIACRYFLELSEEETAAALDVRIGTVKSRTSRALDHLRESYG